MEIERSMFEEKRKKAVSPCSTEDHKTAIAAMPDEPGGRNSADPPSGEDAREGQVVSSHTAAARVIMKLMYAVRMARPDLIRSSSYLARFLTTWGVECDKWLHKLMVYVSATTRYRMYAWSAKPDEPVQYRLECFSDADSAGCSQAQRSTTGRWDL